MLTATCVVLVVGLLVLSGLAVVGKIDLEHGVDIWKTDYRLEVKFKKNDPLYLSIKRNS